MKAGVVAVAVALLSVCTLSACAGNSAAPTASMHPQTPVGDKAIPEAVSLLFYAIKDSLDYGALDGDAVQRPRPRLEDYSRVTSQVLDRFSKAWKVVLYRVDGGEYEIVVESVGTPRQRYRATRMNQSIWNDGRWLTVGAYTYL